MNTVPPKISQTNTRFAALVLVMVVLAVMAFIYFINPSAHHFYPVCQFHRLTGLNCPGCGATRAMYALLHGNIATAVHDNVLFVVGLALAGLRGGWFLANHLRGRANGPFFPPRLLLPVLVVMLVFGILRNLPAFAFLSP